MYKIHVPRTCILYTSRRPMGFQPMNGEQKMGTESGARHLDPVANMGIRARWSWRRVERRAVADHEHWLAAKLRRLAAEKISVFGAAPSTAGQAAAGIVRLRLRGWQLLLAGVAAGPRADLERAGRQGR